ncbi:MAG TPA: YihY/virulence factor BrkB family protein [Solirubrobacteraceae bacterium]|nr:YihY/virulence factor BrkB family protein [Solirubrobacteraceae bacterium]
MATRADRTGDQAEKRFEREDGRRPAERKPDDPTDVGARGWWATIKRTVKEFKEDNITDWAAALTYYGVLSLFPALIALVSIVGLVGDPQKVTDTLLEIVGSLGPSSATDTFRGPIEQITTNRGGAGLALVLSLAAALWSASGYIGAFMRASNAIYEVDEGRPFWKLRPLQIFVTLVMVMLTAIVTMSLIVSGPVAKAVGDAIGLGDTAVTVWNVAKWPVLLVIVMGMLAVLYHVSPNVRLPSIKWISPGSVFAVVIWIVASVLFAFYVANFGSYNKTYGSLAGVIVFLLWLWITNIAILLGAEMNAELERTREIEAGEPGADERIQLPPRAEPKT